MAGLSHKYIQCAGRVYNAHVYTISSKVTQPTHEEAQMPAVSQQIDVAFCLGKVVFYHASPRSTPTTHLFYTRARRTAQFLSLLSMVFMAREHRPDLEATNVLCSPQPTHLEGANVFCFCLRESKKIIVV